MPKLKADCLLCKAAFEYYSSEKNGKYCSNNCRVSHKKQIAGIDKERSCSFCFVPFFPKTKLQKTCSKECGIKSGGKIKEKIYVFHCKNCNISCESHRKSRITYCSQKCYFELIADIAEEWKKERICIECNEAYSPSYKVQKFCSISCVMMVRGREKTETNTVLVDCCWCKLTFSKVLSKVVDSNFCSPECFHLSLRDGSEKKITKNCKNCQIEFELLYIDRAQEFCSKSCSKSGKFHPYFGKVGPAKGIKPWTFGLTKETDDRIRILSEKISIIHKGYFKDGTRKRLFGTDNPNWKDPKDRKAPLNLSIRQCKTYKLWRYSIFKRDNFACVICNSTTKNINADHIKRFCDILLENNIKSTEDALKCEELWDQSNGRTLCVPCHIKTATYGNKKQIKENAICII